MTRAETVQLTELLADDAPPAWPAIRDAVRAAERRGVRTLSLPAPAPDEPPAPVEATTLAAAVLRATTELRVVVPLDPARVAPYNAARILATLAHLAPGRVLLADAGTGPEWADYRAAIDHLWHSFPPEAIIADRATGRYLDPAALPGGGYAGSHHRVGGPLNLPTPPGPPLGRWPAADHAADHDKKVPR
ncbi:LLM class flavin-dependent oxidoreductase [Streptomyces profundus]|uniref:LLM class flavin-dependent oxidoreductase n=1 Tax=Streptomyces profundus TaxID=2867410 RepID=UPI001D1613D1|nr:LLM class flavin-dependent oxidoreductase [Streptomyces sp. MA3_2.13]UED86735.1 LLM class flavin-dependent oxidoreductase [Streptomyces sp. MA3_2.13]